MITWSGGILILAPLTFGAMVVNAQVSSLSSSASNCEKQIYKGFDSRLELNVVGRLPDPKASVVGFEIVNHRPLVALAHELLGYEKSGIVEFPVSDTVKAITVNRQSDLLVQTTEGVLKLGDDGFTSEQPLATAIHGRLYNSGSSVYLEARSRMGLVQFLARRRDGTSFPVATIRGALRVASWNERGLAAVVGNSLFVWEAGGKSVVRLLTDEGLAAAHDISLVGSRRVALTLKSSVILVTSETMTVLVGMPAARCRFDNGVLYLLDGQSGVIWALQGLSQVGTKNADRDHAQKLIEKARKDAGENSSQFLEAARIVGCPGAQSLLLAEVSHGH